MKPSSKKESPKPPPTEAEISLDLIKKLVDVSQKISSKATGFLDQVPALQKIYDEEAIEKKLVDPIGVAADLKDLVISNGSLEETIASNDTLKELWTGEIYVDFEEDHALKKLTEDLSEVLQVITTKSYKTYLKY